MQVSKAVDKYSSKPDLTISHSEAPFNLSNYSVLTLVLKPVIL